MYEKIEYEQKLALKKGQQNDKLTSSDLWQLSPKACKLRWIF